MHDAMIPEVKAALAECRDIIRKGSKSFSLAARLFDPATRDAAVFLYGWCRYCDDQIDREVRPEDPAELNRRLRSLKERTAEAFSFAPQQEPVFIALQYIVHRYAIPAYYALELIEGMAMDVRGTHYGTLKELLLYCYRVAGTVGLMMAHVMGLRDERALRHAADLGIAMQLTNIARDIIEEQLRFAAHRHPQIFIEFREALAVGLGCLELAQQGQRHGEDEGGECREERGVHGKAGLRHAPERAIEQHADDGDRQHRPQQQRFGGSAAQPGQGPPLRPGLGHPASATRPAG